MLHQKMGSSALRTEKNQTKYGETPSVSLQNAAAVGVFFADRTESGHRSVFLMEKTAKTFYCPVFAKRTNVSIGQHNFSKKS